MNRVVNNMAACSSFKYVSFSLRVRTVLALSNHTQISNSYSVSTKPSPHLTHHLVLHTPPRPTSQAFAPDPVSHVLYTPHLIQTTKRQA